MPPKDSPITVASSVNKTHFLYLLSSAQTRSCSADDPKIRHHFCRLHYRW